MRTTLDIDADILSASRQIARERKTSIGKVLSELARQGLRPASTPVLRNGFELLPPGPEPQIVTLDLVNRLREDSLPEETSGSGERRDR
jgi:hypothetical protein